MPDRPFETVPELPWQGTHQKAHCDRCRHEHHHLYRTRGEWLCASCKHDCEEQRKAVGGHIRADMAYGLSCWAIGLGMGWVACLVWFAR